MKNAARPLVIPWMLATVLGCLACNHSDDSPRDLDGDTPDLHVPQVDGGTDGGQGSLDLRSSDLADAGNPPSGSLCTPTGFCFEYPAQFGIPLHDVWADSATSAWAVGYSGAILHFDGRDWTIAKSPTRNTLYGISGRSGSDILAVGESGTVVKFDGTSWSVIDLGVTAHLYDVAMPSPSESWIVGEKTLLRNKTGSWQPVTPPYAPTTRSYLHAIDPSHLWVFHAGIAQFWNGTSWSTADLDNGVALHPVSSVSGKREDAVYACIPQETYPLRRWTGSNFIRVNLPDPVRVLALNECAVEAVSGSDVWLFGDAGIGHFDGTTWTVSESSRQRAVRSVSSSGSTGIAVGNNGRVLTLRGTSWTVQNAGPESSYSFAQSIREKAGVEWTAVGGAILRKSRGGTWQRTPHSKLEVGGLLPIDPTHAWAVSTSASADAVLYFNGTSFESKASGPAMYWMNESWQSPDSGELVFVGQSGITSYQGGVFSRLVTVGVYGWVHDISGSMGSDTWAVGDGGAAWRRKLPAGFVAVPTGTMADLYSVRVVSSSEVYLGGDSATLLRYDGSALQPLSLPALRFGMRNYRMVVDIAGELSSPRGLWVLVSGGEVIELHEGKQPVIHSLYFEGNNLEFTAPLELVVVGSGESIVRKKL
ncbi:MAG TPA: hypothetical protein PK472_04075 [Pseudomonadota bacterium]|nr:hypothetical protein [Pseudomonadota bacterium]HND09813.1 hypothetical protein [Pseudomonadota bacterium]HNN53270.1 hypothetical protein [Pseudomonadota bacterium]